MRILVLTLVIAVLSLLLNAVWGILPWYTTFIIAFCGGIYSGRMKTKAFMAGFLGVVLFWATMLFISHFKSNGLITTRIAAFLSEFIGLAVPGFLVIIVTLLIGGMIGGMAAASGKLLAEPTAGNNRYGRHNNRHKGSYKLKLN